jgi:ABC-type multidrug transport system ATPase subunit
VRSSACSGRTAPESQRRCSICLEIRRRVGFLPGDFALYPKLTGAKVLDYLAELRGRVDRRVRDGPAERFHADLDRPIRGLSTGNRQKLGLIQACMHDPELLILDEPIAGLDPLGLPVVTEQERTLSRLAELSAVRWQPAAWASHLV